MLRTPAFGRIEEATPERIALHRIVLQLLRGRQRPVTAQQLADRMSVSVRTVYRDIDALVKQRGFMEAGA